ncbi:sigma-70 family RNA polymerase sigma factor [Maribacter sp. ANRC-HE7]|uniref:Sigma-70 family RNA polymerase sigma factor n=1 Tax=Maribacter aquimaris TaxID=2737171 RepID=A0ABR7V5L1_9FLAO|nr:sigma-70 family RNA polymerase sigma factor [Maribacter aquimaris]MBD0780087.1 sigma-70 family RNA polymerase sigma factor [Maribacter aquimaris]
METQEIWDTFNDGLYFFILKKVKDQNAANDIFQNTFLKIHKNRSQLKNPEKAKAWVFQIARNEINNHFTKESQYVEEFDIPKDKPLQSYQNICCFDKFINDLPTIYREVIELVYIEGKKQKEAAQTLNISLENVKARIRRAKEILKKNLNACCKYEFDEKGNLKGEPDCAVCHT